MSRRVIHDPEVREAQILQALRDGNTRKASCAYAGISEDTFARWAKAREAFGEAVVKAESDAEVRHVGNISTAAANGIWTASAWWLERRRHEDWGRKDRIDVIQIVRTLAVERGLTAEETERAVAEAERYVRETASHAPSR